MSISYKEIMTDEQKEDFRNYQKEYYKKNKDIISKKHKLYYLEHLDEIKIRINKENNKKRKKEWQKEYLKKNIVKLKKNRQIYNIKNREFIKEKDSKRQKIYAFEHRNNILLRGAKKRAKKFKLDFNLQINDIIIPDICPYLNTPLIVEINTTNKDNSPSIDRICNKLGYTKENSIIVSNRANFIKRDFSIEEIKLILKNYDKINNSSSSDKTKIKKKMFACAKQRAKKHNIKFEISIEDIVIPDICPILEIPLFSSIGKYTANSPSLDRIDNTKPYIKGNIRVISNRANTGKSNSTKEEYELFAKNIEKIMIERGLI